MYIYIPTDEAAVRVHAEYSINPNEDLNKLPQDEVNRKKMIMDEVFEKNRLRPTDPDYQYDKQVDFSCPNKVQSGWDDDAEEEEAVSDENKKDVDAKEDGTKDHITDSVLGEVEEDKIETFDGNDDEDYFW